MSNATPYSARSASRSQQELTRWGIELLTALGFRHEYGFHLMVWRHDARCPLHPKHGPPHPWIHCRCQPDGVLVLHVGTTEERRVDVVRDGMALQGHGQAT